MVDTRYPEADVDGFLFVMFISYGTHGEALVRGPGGGIATLIWSTGEPVEFRVLTEPGTEARWGSYSVQLPLPITSDAEAATYLAALLPELRPRWQGWRDNRRLSRRAPYVREAPGTPSGPGRGLTLRPAFGR